MRIYLMGFMGAGKTHWGKKLRSTLALPLFDLDDEIEKGEKMDIPHLFERFGEEHFRQLESRYLKKISEQEDALISCGGGTPCYLDNMAFMNGQGLTVWLKVPVEVMVNRIKKSRNTRPLLKELTESELTEYVSQKLEERTPFYNQAQLILNPIKFNLQTITAKIQSCANLI